MLHECMEQWSASQIPSFHCMLSPLSRALAPADTSGPCWTTVPERQGGDSEVRAKQGRDEILTCDSTLRGSVGGGGGGKVML